MGAAEQTSYSFSTAVPQPERRLQPRHITILRVGSLFLDGSAELCLIRNISAGGMMVRLYSEATVGQGVEVELKTNHRIKGKISWATGTNAGIAFDEPVDVEELLANHATTDNGWRPRLPRIEVDRLATLRSGARIYGVSTRDISQGGVKVETDYPFTPAEPVVLTLQRFRPIQGVVRWYDNDLCGISFNEILPFSELMAWIRDKRD